MTGARSHHRYNAAKIIFVRQAFGSAGGGNRPYWRNVADDNN